MTGYPDIRKSHTTFLACGGLAGGVTREPSTTSFPQVENYCMRVWADRGIMGDPGIIVFKNLS